MVTQIVRPLPGTPLDHPKQRVMSKVYCALLGLGRPRLLGDTHMLLPCMMQSIQSQDPSPVGSTAPGWPIVVVVEDVNDPMNAEYCYAADLAIETIEKLGQNKGVYDGLLIRVWSEYALKEPQRGRRQLICELVRNDCLYVKEPKN